MFRKTILIACVLTVCLNFSWAEMASSAAKDEAAYALLDKLVFAFKNMADKGTGGSNVVNKVLSEIMAETKKAEAQKQLDPVFFRRYRRMLIIIKLMITEDAEGILEPLIERDIREFVLDIYGEEAVYKEGKLGIGVIAGALAEEILNLKMYLDTKEQRAKLFEEYKKQFSIMEKKK